MLAAISEKRWALSSAAAEGTSSKKAHPEITSYYTVLRDACYAPDRLTTYKEIIVPFLSVMVNGMGPANKSTPQSHI